MDTGSSTTKTQDWIGNRSKKFNVIASIVIALAVFSGLLFLITSYAKNLPELLKVNFDNPTAALDFGNFGSGSWRVANGTYELYNAGQPTKQVGNTNMSIAKTTLGIDEWRMSSDAKIVTGDASLVFDFVDENNYYFVNLSPTTTDKTNGIFKMENGNFSRLAPLPATSGLATNYRVEIRKKGDDIKVYREDLAAKKGAEYLNRATGKKLASFRVGFGSVNGTATFDNLLVSGEGKVKDPVTPTDPETPPEPTTPTTPQNPTTPPPTPPTPPTTTTTPDGGRNITVNNVDQLKAALADAQPGDVITMADGVYLNKKGVLSSVAVGTKSYTGTFTAVNKNGTAAKPIVLQGSRNAVIDGGGTGSQYGFYLVNSSYWTLKGFTITNVTKGVVLDGSSRNTIDGIEVRQTGQEGIHLRAFSSDNVVKNNIVRETGLKNSTYGEGLYVGSANSNWGTYTGGKPDASDRNQLIDNVITQTGAESMDIKEGTTGGLIKGNYFDGKGMTGSWADSWIDMKGNNWTVSNNHGVNALQDGFQVHGALSGWGNNNIFASNLAEVNGPGFGFWQQNNVSGNLFGCGNTVTGAASGFANVPCRN